MREPTLGEIWDDLQEMKASIGELSSKIDRTYVRQDVYAAEQAARNGERRTLEARVGRVEERFTWIARTALTALVLPILSSTLLIILMETGKIR